MDIRWAVLKASGDAIKINVSDFDAQLHGPYPPVAEVRPADVPSAPVEAADEPDASPVDPDPAEAPAGQPDPSAVNVDKKTGKSGKGGKK